MTRFLPPQNIHARRSRNLMMAFSRMLFTRYIWKCAWRCLHTLALNYTPSRQVTVESEENRKLYFPVCVKCETTKHLAFLLSCRSEPLQGSKGSAAGHVIPPNSVSASPGLSAPIAVWAGGWCCVRLWGWCGSLSKYGPLSRALHIASQRGTADKEITGPHCADNRRN